MATVKLLCNFGEENQSIRVMVIQRWQSVFLLLAAIVMAFFCVTPFAIQNIGGEGVKVYPYQIIDYFVLVIITAVLLFIAIFLFKNLRRQKLVVVVALVWQVIVAVRAFIFILTQEEATIEWGGGILLVVCSLLLTLAAYRRICKDERLLKSYDRIR